MSKPKLKILRNKDQKMVYHQVLNNQLRGEFDHSAMSPNSRMKISDIQKEKKGKKKSSHKRIASSANAKQYALITKSQPSIHEDTKTIKVLCDTLSKNKPMVIKNLNIQKGIISKCMSSK